MFTASSKQAPFVVDAQVQPIIDPTQVYSGMWGNVNVNFFAYNSAGKKGIGCGLNGVQKTGDGDPLGSRVTAQEAFQPVAAAPGGGPGNPRRLRHGRLGQCRPDHRTAFLMQYGRSTSSQY